MYEHVLISHHFLTVKLADAGDGGVENRRPPGISGSNSAVVRISLNLDQLAVEPLEDFILELNYLATFEIAEEHVFIQNLTVLIIDSDSE